MNLNAKLAERAAAGSPIRVGMIGAGRFGSMFFGAGAARLRGAADRVWATLRLNRVLRRRIGVVSEDPHTLLPEISLRSVID